MTSGLILLSAVLYNATSGLLGLNRLDVTMKAFFLVSGG